MISRNGVIGILIVYKLFKIHFVLILYAKKDAWKIFLYSKRFSNKFERDKVIENYFKIWRIVSRKSVIKILMLLCIYIFKILYAKKDA